MDANPKLKAVFDGPSYTKRRVMADGIAGAKTAETRDKRMNSAIRDLQAALAAK